MLFVDTKWQVRIDVQQPHFNVLNALVQQTSEKVFAWFWYPFGPDRRIKLGLGLQNIGVDLSVLAVNLQADILLFGMFGADRAGQRRDVILKAVVADLHVLCLGITLVTQVAASQRSGVWHKGSSSIKG